MSFDRKPKWYEVLAWMDDEQVNLFYPAPGAMRSDGQKLLPMTIQDFATASIPQGIPFQIVTIGSVPDDRYFRSAWTLEDDTLTVDTGKAQAIHMDNIRAERNKRLQVLDAQFMEALGKADEAKMLEINAQKQVLRDLPQAFDLAQAENLSQLKALWPDELGENPHTQKVRGNE